jgi:hypothetical protein
VLTDRNRIRIKTVCLNQNGDEVLTGEAWVMPSKTPVVYEERPRESTADPGVAYSPWLWPARAVAFWGSLGLAMLGRTTSADRR